MKLQVVHNTDLNVIKQGLEMAKSKCPFPLDFSYQPTTKKFTSIPISTDVVISGYAVNYQEILNETLNTNTDVSLLIYDPRQIYPQPTNPCTHTMVGEDTIQIPSTWFTDYQANKFYPEVLCQFLLHELCHWVAHKMNVPDLTHSQNSSSFSQKHPNEYYLFLLSQYKEIPIISTPTYKYFKLTESTGGGHTVAELKPELVALLDKIREECGFPLKITSGMRTVGENWALKDAVSDSSHLDGSAVDLVVSDSVKRFKLVTVALKNGVTRIGQGKDFVHLDISKGKLQNCMWTYY